MADFFDRLSLDPLIQRKKSHGSLLMLQSQSSKKRWLPCQRRLRKRRLNLPLLLLYLSTRWSLIFRLQRKHQMRMCLLTKTGPRTLYYLLPLSVTLPSSTSSTPASTNPVAKSTPAVKSLLVVKSPPFVRDAGPKAPPAKATSELEKLKPFLRFNDGVDSDVAATAALPVCSSTSAPRKSSLKPRSKSRPRSRAQTPSRDRSRSRLSPKRDDFHRKKPVGSLPSSYFTGFTSHDVSPQPVYQLDPMPVDLNDAAWKDDFLAWTLREMRKSWRAGERAWVNLHIALYLYDPTRKYPIAHPRAFAACSIAGDAALPERFCCWSCQNVTTGGTAKSLWPDMDAFTYHWHQVHALPLQSDWTELAFTIR